VPDRDRRERSADGIVLQVVSSARRIPRF